MEMKTYFFTALMLSVSMMTSDCTSVSLNPLAKTSHTLILCL